VNEIPGMSGKSGNAGSDGRAGIESGIEGIGIANFKVGRLGIAHFDIVNPHAIVTMLLSSLFITGGGVGPTVVTPTGEGIVC